jgi:uncharacterized sulfatase
VAKTQHVTRRAFLASAAALAAWLRPARADAPARRPNILWLTCEDIGPHLGCYGDAYATTPNLDRLAAKGTVYRNAWSTAPVCAPARTAIITGVYPPSTGSQHMRSMAPMPAGMKMFPQLLREAGYYCTNNRKEDYNLAKPGRVWDASSARAHWRNRKPGQPFFAVFNMHVTHESRLRKRPHKAVHDPARARVPAHHPDTPEVRRDWAQYYDNITVMDRQVAFRLRELEKAGLAGDTIVFFYGDHGSGMPRHKRWPYNSGLHVPLIVHVPSKYRSLASKDCVPGGRSDRLVGFVDLAPTLLSLAGVKPPAFMQGHAFLGRHEAPPQRYLYGFRGRMDERYDMVRSVRDKRYVYIRNYMPHLIYGQHVAYMFKTPTTRVWRRLHQEGKLTPAQDRFWRRKPPEELYDLQNDPDEVKDLAGSPAHREILERMRGEQEDFALRIRDTGFLPEAQIHSRAKNSTPYAMGHDDARYPLERVMATAGLAASLRGDALPALRKACGDPDSAVRYWAVMGILMRRHKAVAAARETLQKALGDEAPSVRVIAAQALGQYGTKDDLEKALPVLLDTARLDRYGPYVPILALNAMDALGDRAAGALDAIKALPTQTPQGPKRVAGCPARLKQKILADLAGK